MRYSTLNTRFTDYLHIFVFCAFAVAQPIFDLLSGYPQLFAARQSQPAHVMVLVGVLLFAVPLALVLAQVVVGFASERARSGLHHLQVAALAGLIALPLLKQVPGLAPPMILVGSAILCLVFTALYVRFLDIRRLFSILSLAIIIFPLNFCLLSPVSNILFPASSIPALFGKKVQPVPIIMLVLDELPVTSLMNASHEIDSIRYPNFSRIAKGATWYRNASSVAEDTLLSLPAILTGSIPQKPHRLPTAQEFPVNLFTFLGNSHRLNVAESVTSLCPETLCPKMAPAVQESILTLLADVAVIYLHVILPNAQALGLPDVTQTWGSFLSNRAESNQQGSARVSWLKDVVGPWQDNNDRPEFLRDFLASIKKSPTPALHFVHVPLPHGPFIYLPSGKKYNNGLWGSGKQKDKWVHEWAAAENFQQSLLQLAFVDRLLGEWLDSAETAAIWDDALLIIVSDHGASYKLNDNRRLLSRTNYMDVLPILLLVKYPGQQEGVITDRNVESIDILPTIADVLGAEAPFGMDGHSMLDSSAPQRAQKAAFSKVGKSRVHFDAAMHEKYDTIAYMTDLLGSGSAPIVLQGMGLRRDLLGKQVGADAGTSPDNIEIIVDGQRLYADIDLGGDFLPARVTGKVMLQAGETQSLDLAVAVNGVIQAVGRSYFIDGANRFAIMVPEEAFRSGQNEVRVFVPGAVN